MQTKQINFIHDSIHYTWDNVCEVKYNNWLQNTKHELNTKDYSAWGYPFILQVEPTSLCNLSCTLCPTGRHELNRPYRHMRLNEFKSLIDDMERYLLFLILWDWGEPLMNPELPSIIRYASDRRIQTVTSTNGHFLNDESYTEELLKSGLTTLIVAVDSLRADKYEIYRRNGDIDRVLSGLNKAVSVKKRTGSKTLINVRMVIMKQNEHEIGEIEKMAKIAGADIFTIKTLNPSCGMVAQDAELLPENPRYRRYEYIPNTYKRVLTDAKCQRVWTMSNIFSNGDVVPCCYDYDSEMKVGNIFETPFTQIWNNSAYRQLRKKIYSQMQSIPKCNECGVNYKLSTSGWFVDVIDFRSDRGQISFSIIMPTHNRKHCIKNAIDSLLAQTYQNFELIVIDDGSTDGTDQYLTETYKHEIEKKRILYIKFFDNRGAAYARNEGLKRAQYDWIGYLDTDNQMHENFLATFAENIEKTPSCEIYYAQIMHRLSQDIIGHEFNFDELIQFNFIDLGVFVHSVRIYNELGGFDPELRRLIDWDLIIRYTEKYPPKFIEKVLIDYDDSQESLRITNTVACDDAYKKVILNYFERIPANNFIEKYTGQIQQFIRAADERDKLISMLKLSLVERDAQISDLKQAEAKLDDQITSLTQDTATRDRLIAKLDKNVSEQKALLTAITSSRSWKITRPLRFAARIKRGEWAVITSGLRPYIKRWGSSFYKYLPFSADTKNRLVDFAFKHAGLLFEGMLRYETWKQTNIRKSVLPSSQNLIEHSTPNLRDILKTQNDAKITVPLSDSFGVPQSYDVICFPIIEWDHRFQRPQQLMTLFAQDGHRVFYLHLSFHNRSNAVEWQQVAERIFQIQLPGPTNLNRFFESLTPDITTQCLEALEKFCTLAKIKDAICMVQLPFWAPLALSLREKHGWKVLFDCMDEHQGLTILRPELLHHESMLARKSDLVIVSAKRLWDKHANHAPRSIFLPNAADFNHFNCPSKRNELETISRPIIGYYGAIMEWFDTDMLMGAAKARPDWSFVMIGNIDTTTVEPLRKLPNVYFLGEQPYSLLPGYLHRFDVCLIPFKNTPIIESTNPVKFYEYMSAGKPVIATPMNELLPYQEFFYPARNAEELVAQITRALQEDSSERVRMRINWARHETWQARYERLATAINDLYGLVSIVMVSYHNLDKLRTCLESIIEKTHYPRYEIIIVDNCSSPDVTEYLNSIAQEALHIRVIFNKENLGFACATNVGLQAISENSHYIILLNNDTVVTYGWMTGLTRWLSNPDVGLVGPVTCPNGAANEAAIPIDYTDLAEMETFAQRYTAEHHGIGFDIPMLAMYCLAMRRDTYEEVGPLDEQFGVGMFEDDDYSLRVRIKGYRIVCAEDVFIHHFGRASFSQLNNREYRKIFKQNRRLFEEKWNIKWQLHSAR